MNTEVMETIRIVAKSIPMQIRVTRDAKAIIEGIAEDRDMKEIGVASRIYEWFGQQDPIVQRAVLGWTLDPNEVEKARKLFKPLVVARGVVKED